MDAYRNFARRNPAVFITFNLIFSILWISVIMGFSGEDADISGLRSARILVGLINTIAPEADVTLDNYESLEALENSEKVIRKTAHMIEYGVLAFFVWAVLFGFADLRRRYAYIIPVIFSAAVGALDERHQTAVRGRYGTWIDVCVDAAGAVIAVFTAYALTKRYRDLKRMLDRDPGLRASSHICEDSTADRR